MRTGQNGIKGYPISRADMRGISMKRFFCLCALSFVIMIPTATAQTVSGVSGAGVTKGKLDVEARVGFQVDNDSDSQDERIQSRLHFDYGVTNWWAPRLIIRQDKRKGNNFEHAGLTWENRFQFTDRKDIGVDLGGRFSYTLADGDKKPDDFSWRLIQAFTPDEAGLWDVRLNQIFSTDVGEDREDDLTFEWRARATREMSDTIKLGFQTFNRFGDVTESSSFSEENHTIGPVLIGKTPWFSYETGYLAGISDGAADHAVRLFVKKSF